MKPVKLDHWLGESTSAEGKIQEEMMKKRLTLFRYEMNLSLLMKSLRLKTDNKVRFLNLT